MLEGEQSCVARKVFRGLGIAGVEMIKENRNGYNVSNCQGFHTLAQKLVHTFRYLCSGFQGYPVLRDYGFLVWSSNQQYPTAWILGKTPVIRLQPLPTQPDNRCGGPLSKFVFN